MHIEFQFPEYRAILKEYATIIAIIVHMHLTNRDSNMKGCALLLGEEGLLSHVLASVSVPGAQGTELKPVSQLSQ